ncbi:MAG: dipeptidase [Fervidicoccaceae archaeon]
MSLESPFFYPSIDLHEDVSAYFLYHGGGAPLGDFSEDIPGRDADIPKYRKAGVKIVFSAIFTGIESFSPEESRALKELYGSWMPATKYRVPQSILWEHISIYYKMAEAYGIKFVETYEDAERCLKEDVVCFLLHMEGAEPIDEPYDLVVLKKLGLRSIGITWNYQNKYGTGCTSKKDLGLTSDGEELIRTANRLGIIVDLAHASKRTVMDALSASKKPMIISHANVRKIVDRSRNVDDEILEMLYKNNGVLGISAIGPLISNKQRPSMEDLINHFVHVKENFGTDILAIGTDFLGLLGLPAPEGFESIDRLPNLYSKLSEKGFDDKDLKKIAFENVMRVLKANLL